MMGYGQESPIILWTRATPLQACCGTFKIKFNYGGVFDVSIGEPDTFLLLIHRREDSCRTHGRTLARICTLCSEALVARPALMVLAVAPQSPP